MPATHPPHLNELRQESASATRQADTASDVVRAADFYKVVAENRPIEQAEFGSSSRRAEGQSPAGETTVRHIIESFLCLAIAVVVFRSFVLEGYIISTGSMAPTLLGYHKRVECPDCEFRFAVGVAFDDGSGESSFPVRCPNCQQANIDASHVPRNSGDQLLVFKEAFSFRDPDRWEIAVFLNPNDPTQAYVKRTIGRPGEEVQIRDGDVFIDGQRARKPYSTQRSIRIPVFDDLHYPQYDRTFARWLPEPGWSHSKGLFKFSPSESAIPSPVQSGLDVTPELPLGPRPSPLGPAFAWVNYFHLDRNSTRVRGNLDDATIAAGGFEKTDEEASTPGPITDSYGYNKQSRARKETAVHDLMLNCRVAFRETRGEFAAVLRNRRRFAAFRLDRESHSAAVWLSGRSAEHAQWLMASGQRPLASAAVAHEMFSEPVEVDVSTFDRQLIVGLNATQVLKIDLDQPLEESVPSGSDDLAPPITDGGSEIVLTSHESTEVAGTKPENADAEGRTVQFGARGGAIVVNDLRLYRDVHYTAYDYKHGVKTPVRLGDDEFFFLGDNSPVSLDSRGWKSPTVSRQLIVGRPLVVHLPSRPSELQLGDQTRSIRVPDFSRMRYVR